MDLFGPDLLDGQTHLAVFGELPSSLVRDLRTAEVGDLVLQLLDAGWRPGQLAVRVGALPAGEDPVGAVSALLRALRAQQPPDARWREERAQRRVQRSRAEAEAPASEPARQRWLAQMRADLAAPPAPRRVTPLRVRPACASCGAESTFFVTRDVHLCEGCVALLGTGAVRLSEAG